MKVHSDILTAANLLEKLPPDIYAEPVEQGSNSRARAFEIKLSADPGTSDAHGNKRRYSTNSGLCGGDRRGPRAATWVEYGDWMVELLKIDPDALIGNYAGARDFIVATFETAPHRPAHENAVKHQERWATELGAE